MAEGLGLQIKLQAYPTQAAFINAPEMETAFIGGIGSGKTHSGAIKALKFNFENKGVWGIVTAPTMRILEQATMPTYLKVFPPEFIVRSKMRPHPEWELANGGKILFWSTDKPETIAGIEVAWGHMDEASLSPYQAYLNIKKRMRQRKLDGKPYDYRLWMTTSPRQLNWIYHEITKVNSTIKMFNASTRDNIYLDNREDYIAALGITGKQYEQEIEGKFVFLQGDCLFPTEILEARLADCLPPVRTLEDGYCVIWKEPVVGATYLAAADCADEGGGGVNDLIIIDAQTGEEVAELNADIPADEFAIRAKRVLEEYGCPLFAPERNGTAGGVVLTKFIDMGYKNLYKDHLGKFGWYTTTIANPPKISRYTMLIEYEEAVRRRNTIIHSAEAISEMSTFVRTEGDIYKPREGCRSDRIMARAICWQLRKVKNKSSIGFSSFQRVAYV